MGTRNFFATCVAIITPFIFLAQAPKYIRKAENSIDRGNLKEAIDFYQEALKSNPNDRSANMELGLVYCELLDNYNTALPYLEKAYNQPGRDSAYDLLFALGKCYHFKGEFEKALGYFARLKDVQDLEKETDFQKELGKRKQDCEYAMGKSTYPLDENIYLVNAGKRINTDMPEYVPVLTAANELLFTSKRKDDEKEELSFLDGKYFESMYIAPVKSNGFGEVRRYTLPDKLMNSKFYKHHQSVVSISQDGKKLFTFKDSKLYEIDVDSRTVNEPSEVKINQFNHYQNHAFLTRDGKTLYFTSDIPGGLGGTDIYRSLKSENGEWGTAQNLGSPVNTAFDEDAPYLSNDGTLYFASEGHEGFGNYDLYKSYFTEGKWSSPENLGAPINSTGHDIFIVLDSNESSGYFSSGRAGGFGDMDIYKLLYIAKMKKDCPEQNYQLFSLQASDDDTSDFKNKVEIKFPANYKLLSAEWQIDKVAQNERSEVLTYDYGKTGTYQVASKILMGCDTCMTPLVACLQLENKILKIAPPVPVASNKKVEKENRSEHQVQEEVHDQVINNRDHEEAEIPPPVDDKKFKNDKSKKGGNDKPGKEDLVDVKPPRISAVLFEFNSSQITSESTSAIREQLNTLKDDKNYRFEIYGYADARGSDETNKRISKMRAESLRTLLIKEGISTNKIILVKGEGATQFVNDCGPGVECSEEQHRENRRAQLVVIRSKK